MKREWKVSLMFRQMIQPCSNHPIARHLRQAVCLAGLSLLWAAPVQAGIQIQLGGVDIRYDGVNIVDQSPTGADPDPLTNATFIDQSVGNTIGTVNSGVTLNMLIPDVVNIPVGGGQVASASGGVFDLSFGGGDYLSLSLASVGITYQHVAAGPLLFDFVFAGAVAAINGQHLPFQTTLGAPVSITFSTQVTDGTLLDNGTFLTGFTAAGTGEVHSDQFTIIPEPASLGLLALGGVALLSRKRR